MATSEKRFVQNDVLRDHRTLLCFGYIREITQTLKMYHVMPIALFRLIYDFVRRNRSMVAVIGHSDSGKSTLIGRMLYELDALPVPYNKLRLTAESLGRQSYALAWACDREKTERERTRTVHGTYHSVKTNNAEFGIMDCPGHRDFTKNAIRYIAPSDAVIVVAPTNTRALEHSIL